MEKNEKKYDIVVIGGGPAGMIAAGRAAEMGARVVLLEKNATLGKKLLITGKGRCNVTQAEFDDRKMVKKFGLQGKFLFSSLAAFGPEEMMGFLEERGVAMKIERGGRVFPVSDKAQDVLLTMQRYLRENRVDMIYGAEVMGFACSGDGQKKKIEYVKLRQENIKTNKVVLCTGGKSYATTGSTGDGYRWAEECGHQLVDLRPALVPIKTKEKWVTEAQGLSLKNVAVNLIQDEKKQDSRFGEMLFTHFGLSNCLNSF